VKNAHIVRIGFLMCAFYMADFLFNLKRGVVGVFGFVVFVTF